MGLFRPIHIIYVILFAGQFYLSSCGVRKSINDRPSVSEAEPVTDKVEKINDSTFFLGNNFLLKNNQGLWELYVEGDSYERGIVTGELTKFLMAKQEAVFFDRLNKLVPSQSKQEFLAKFLAWYNRKMYKHVPEEFKTEIYGISRYASDDYNDIAPPYLRYLYLHAAHDIGHALQDLAMVGCTSFALWGNKSVDGQLLIGRNFDFYAGDEFAEDKIVAFINPDKGHNFMSLTWGGMIGVVSGMNDQGLTVTINAGKSKVPLAAKTPISIVTREILQYASTIEEAITIAKKRDVFVAESILVGSANDRKAVLIEVAPNSLGVYNVENSEQLICTNHFQSAVYAGNRRHKKGLKEGHTQYRYQRMTELLSIQKSYDVEDAVKILRNKEGLGNTQLGYGNEKAINQLLAHHGIVFKPEELKVWVSSNPYQMGKFVAYDLDSVFMDKVNNPAKASLALPDKNINEDPFIHTEEFRKYEAYRKMEAEIETAIEENKTLTTEQLDQMTLLNPEYWKGYFLLGEYHYENGNYQLALESLKQALNKEVATYKDEIKIGKLIKKSKRKLN